MRGVLLALGACIWLLLPLAAGAVQDPELESLEQALASHPDDPDLLWAKAMTLARLGRPAEAADLLDNFHKRWPDRRPDATFQLGRLHYEAGQHGSALEALTQASSTRPEFGPAQFYRGMALRELGRIDEAAEALDEASWLEPGLRAQVLLIQGLDKLESDENAARTLLLEAARLDESGEIGRLAREALAGRSPRDRPRRWTLFASAGFESDTNVTLESDHLPGSNTNERDDKWVFGAGFRVKAIDGERLKVTAGYRFDQSTHDDLETFDTSNHLPFVTATYGLHRRVTLRLDALYAASVLDTDPYARSLTAQPSVLIEIGPRAGVLRIHGDVTRRGYLDDAPFPSLERSGTTLGGGLTQYVALPFRRGAFGALGASFAKTRTNAGDDLLGFAGDYDRVRWAGNARLNLPLPRGFTLTTSTSIARERYLNRNLVHSLTDEGMGSFERKRRNDTVLESRLGFGYTLTDFVDAELAWRFTRQLSNVDVYEYDRHVFGMYLKTEL